MDEALAMVAFQIISAVGAARSCYIEAIQFAKLGDFAKSEQSIKDGDEAFLEGHKSHAELIQQEAAGEGKGINLLLLHAEDQLMSAEGFKIIALEFIDVYKKFEDIK
jgi:PTS system cellobiose-specific IIA component